MSRTRVSRWTPPFLQALRIAARPAIAFLVFTLGGFAALVGTSLWYNGTRDIFEMFIACTAGIAGLVLGMLVAIFRVRTLPVFIAGSISIFVAVWLIALSHPPFGKEIALAMLFFCFAFPCGLLSLQHRWELLASFWPAVGWIGSVFVILNREGRVNAWEQEKVSAWLPVPLVFLGCFLVLWLFYLASKQAMRVELWQSLSGGVARRVAKKPTVTAVPRKNVLPLLVTAIILFAVTAVLAPYLWRTGKGDRDGKHGKPDTGQVEERDEGRSRRPQLDGEAIVQQMKQLAQAAKNTALKLWPLLLLLLFYRPVKRALLGTHLLTPIVPTPPTERIDNAWEYVRIAAEDAGVMPTPSDSIEQLLTRIRERGLGGPALARAAEIYARTRYGFTVGRGDAIAMRQHAIDAGKELRVNLGAWSRVKNLWRPLA